MQKIKVNAIQSGCFHDGSGVRTTVFLQGCLLHCPWCCNPETLIDSSDYVLDSNICLKHKGIESRFCRDCMLNNGPNELSKCALNAAKPISRFYTPYELFSILEKDFLLMKASGGGVTFSGGEPILHANALIPLLKLLNNNEIDICFETTLIAKKENIIFILPYCNELIIDLKLQPEMMLDNDEYLKKINNYISIFPESCRKTFRLVFIDSMYSKKDDILKKLNRLKICNIQLIKAHNLAKSKYTNLNLEFTDYTPSEILYRLFADFLRSHGVTVDNLMI